MGKKKKLTRCDGCGCTEKKACAGGCAWELPGVCSACVSDILWADAKKVCGVAPGGNDKRWTHETRAMLVYSVLCSLYKRPLAYRLHGKRD